MKIHAISVIKNEADIIAHNLREAAKWAHKIYVLDNGSTDGTWEIVQSLASDTIIPWKTTTKAFYEGIRGEVFRAFKDQVEEGDWWCIRLDADEFYIDDPRDFLTEVPKSRHFVCSDSVEYHLTHGDIEEHEFTGDFAQDRPHINYYYPTTYSEIRFFRHRKRLEWEEELPWPRHLGVVNNGKIRLKHYQYRSPQQIKKRLSTRKTALEGGAGVLHWDDQDLDWKEKLHWRRDLLQEGEDGSVQPQGCRKNHLHQPHKFLVKRVMHGLGVWP